VNIQLEKVSQLLRQREMQLELSDSAIRFLVEAGTDIEYGARPLKRAIQQNLLDPLASDMISGKFAAGDTIHVDMNTNNENLIFTKD